MTKSEKIQLCISMTRDVADLTMSIAMLVLDKMAKNKK